MYVLKRNEDLVSNNKGSLPKWILNLNIFLVQWCHRRRREVGAEHVQGLVKCKNASVNEKGQTNIECEELIRRGSNKIDKDFSNTWKT